MKRKYIDRSQWQRIQKSKCILLDTYQERFCGYAAATFVETVREKLVCNLGSRQFCIVDNGYAWIQRLPVNKNWSVTTMFDNNMNIIQWYFDITAENGIDESGRPYYDDLYLDVVVFPSGEIVLFDEDELKDALSEGLINEALYKLAYAESQKIIEGMAADIEGLIKMSYDDLEYFSNHLL